MEDTGENFKVIGIGASAGGLEALQNFLSHLPSELREHAFIIAQHVSPTYKSMLVTLLSKVANIPVIEAVNGGDLLPGFIYITPPDTEIILASGKFVLRKPTYSAGPKPSIDTLFHSIAENYKSRAIGVILSGTGTDGTLGISNLKAVGGCTIVQEPKTSKFDGMPISAIETGDVDLILPPEEMGEQILSHIKKPFVSQGKQEIPDGETEVLYEILLSLSKRKGTDFSSYKQTTISRRVEKRIEFLKLPNIEAYQSFLEENPEEYETLFETILIGVTAFYRDEDAFISIQEYLNAIIHAKSNGDTIRIWTPGCSTGEEAYSIAILIANMLKEKITQYSIQIFATDIDEKAIAFARKGVYPNTSSFLFKSVDDSSFLIRKEDTFEISKQIRSMVLFTRHDVTKNPPFLKLDMVVCRNLLIYFGQSLQQQIIPLFHYALQPNGILFLGKSETIGNFTDLFVTLDPQNKIYQRKRGGTLQTLKLAGFRPKSTILVPTAKAEPVRKDLSLSEMVKETLYNTFDFPYVIITDNFSIESINGDVNLFLSLPEGMMNANILNMIRPELQVELRFIITKVIRDKEPQKSELIRFSVGEKTYLTSIKVKPLLYSHKNIDLFMIIFELYPTRTDATIQSYLGTEKEQNERILTLEKELTTTKEHLQIYIEELETSNEELQSLNEEVQSTNEELQSTNEELETTIEELQSTNEEIQIAYSELKSANDELSRNDNLLKIKESSQAALLNNSLQAFILTDKLYNILAFNDKARTTIELLFKKPLQLGGNIIDALSRIIFPTLDEDLLRLERGEIVSGETMLENSASEQIYLAYNFSPILDLSQNLTVISISFLDITHTKRTENNLRKADSLLKSIFDAVETGICITDKNGIYIDLNKAYCDIYGFTKEELLGKSFTMVVLPEYRSSVQTLHDRFIAGEEEFPKEWIVQKKDGSPIDVFANAKLLIEPDGTRYRVTSVRDITEKNKYKRLLHETQEMTHVGGWVYDKIKKSLSITKETYHLFHLHDNSTQDMSDIAALFSDADGDRLLKHFRLAVEENLPFDLLLSYEDKLARKFWYRAIATPPAKPDHSNVIFGAFQDVTERINYEFQIQETHELLEQTNETARVGGWEYYPLTNENKWTKVTYDIHEVDPGFIPKVDQGLLFYKEGYHRERIQFLFNELMLKGIPFDEEFEIITAKKNLKWVRATGRATFENGKCVRLYGAFLDIHEMKKSSEMIRLAKERYDFLAKASKEAIWDWDIDENRVYLGEGFRSVFGFQSAEEFQNLSDWTKDIHPEDYDLVLASFHNLINSEEENQLTLEYRYKKENGEYATVMCRCSVIRNEMKKAVRIVGALQDFTKKKEEEHRLRLLESVITNSTDSVIITEAEPFSLPGPRIVYVNQAFTKMTGYTAGEVIGRTPRFLQGPKTDIQELKKLRIAMEKWEPCEIQVLNYKKNGEEFWNHFSVFPLANEVGWFTHWIAIEKDVTGKKLEDEEKEKLISELTQNNKDLKQFTYITSHNLRAPLSNLTAALNIIDDIPITDPTLSTLLKGIRTSTSNLNQTIDDLIKILIIKDNPALEQSELSLQNIFDTVCSLIQNIIDASGAEIITSFDEVSSLTFNRSYLESIFLNLLTNAIKYRSPERKLNINIRTSKQLGVYHITFSDNGLGIDLSKHRDKVFGLYQRFHNLPDSKGLGLYLVKSQIESLGGTIELESEVDVGSKFTLKIKGE